MKILFTGGGGSGNEALWRQLNHKYELYFADANPGAIDSSIPLERRIGIPKANEAGFQNAIHDLCTSRKIDVLVPGVDEELSIVAKLHETAPFKILLPPKEFVDLMLDKFAGSRAIHSAGLNAPETHLLSEPKEIGFPLIAKPRSGRGSRGVMKLLNSKQLSAYLELQNLPADAFIAQELAVGAEYTVFVAADQSGRLRAVVPVKVLEKRGITISAEVEANREIVQYIQDFQKIFKPTGIYNLQCIVDDRGKVWPFEINPRVSTTFCLVIESGFDPFEPYDSTAPLFLPTSRIGLQRNWKNNFFHK